MVNLDLSNLETISAQHLRVLQAIEQGMRNHAYVPMPLIISIANIPSTNLFISDLHRLKLIECVNHTNFCLTYLGADYLALVVIKKRGLFDIVGTRVGVGKEADVYIGQNSQTKQLFAIKFHKLGLTSFKKAREKRNYMEHRGSASWMKMSRLAAMREFGFMLELNKRQFTCPKVYTMNRHCVVMGFATGLKMCGIRGLSAAQASRLGWDVWHKMVQLLRMGIVHGDLNEYNVIVQATAEALGIEGETTFVPSEPVGQAEQNEKVEGEQNEQNGELAQPEEVAEQHDQPEEAEEADEVEVENVVEKRTFTSNLPKLAQIPAEDPADRFYTNVVVIDFPQMITVYDQEAELQFDRDIHSFESFLNRRFSAGLELPRFSQIWHLVEDELQKTDKMAANERYIKRIIEEQGDDNVKNGLRPGRNVRQDVRKEVAKNERTQKKSQKLQKGQGRQKKGMKDGWE